MFETFQKLKYGARVLLSRNQGQPETIDVAGRPTVIATIRSDVGEAGSGARGLLQIGSELPESDVIGRAVG